MSNKYSDIYKGNAIFYDPDATQQAVNEIVSIVGDMSDRIADIASQDNYFDSVPARYISLVPSPRFASIKSNVERTLSGASQRCLSQIGSVTGAIQDYCDGNGFSAESEAILNRYSKGIKSPSGGDGSDSSGSEDDKLKGPGSEDSNSTSNPEVKNDPATDDDLASKSPDISGAPENSSGLTEEISIPLASAVDSSIVTESAASALGVSVMSAVGNDNLSETSTLLDEFASSFGSSTGASVISIPSPLIGSMDGVKNSSAIAATGVAIAAVASIGGKVLYDKTRNDDDEDEDDNEHMDEDITELNEKSGSVVNDGFISGVSVIDLKKELLENGEVTV